ncbi:MAG TPA: AGE family epimerase/isomerase [archaeon]|nr:AGE family epimerase/isomerase [archaeon]
MPDSIKIRYIISALLLISTNLFYCARGNEGKTSLQSAKPVSTPHAALLPERIAGMTLEELKADYRERFFNRYLQFWDRGGYDKELGGFICNLNDDGTPVDDEKNLWYQGRGIWVYSFLYNNFGKEERYLEMARKTRDFTVRYMLAGQGRWYEIVHRDGRVIEGVSKSVYGWLFAASGLVEYYKAAGRDEDLELARETLRAALETYNDPDYEGIFLPEGMLSKGIRAQGVSMVLLGLLTQLLSLQPDPELEKLAVEQVDLIMNRFYNPEYGITNEYLSHDYSRIPGFEDQMFTGHSVEVLWMVMYEALRKKDRALFNATKDRLRRYMELSWDYVFDGFGTGDFYVFSTPGRQQGTDYSVKTMWHQCEATLGCMVVLEYTGETWAREWYERTRAFTLRTVANNKIGVWDQAADRFGKIVPRKEYHPKRKGNFHQPRYMMLDILILERMIKNNGKTTPFPS